MLHCHVASTPAYTHFLHNIQDNTADKIISFMYMAFKHGWLYLCVPSPPLYYWALQRTASCIVFFIFIYISIFSN